MNKKIKKIFELNIRFYFIMLLLFAAATFIFKAHATDLAVIELFVIVLLFIYSRFSGRKRNSEILKYIESITYSVDSAAKDSLLNFPFPTVIFSLDQNKILTTNDSFLKIIDGKEHLFEKKITEAIPGFSGKWLMEGRSECPNLVPVNGKMFRVYGSIVRAENNDGTHNYLGTTYWVDVTALSKINSEYVKSRPVFAIIMLDNYDELFKGLTDKDKSAMLSLIDDRIGSWASGCEGYISKFDRDRYIFIFEERYLQSFIDSKFSLLDTVREITAPNGVQATISIGVGREGKNIAESFQFAALSTEMALSRGGDQAVIKNRYNFEFFGGRSSKQEKRTKVKSRVMANSLSALMRDASQIYIMGHKYADLDTIGAAVGLCCIARKNGQSAKIVLDLNENFSKILINRMLTLPEYEDVFITPQDAMLHADVNSLLIVVDTNRPEQVESKELLMSCNRVAVIDHHRRAATYIQNAALSFHEPYASSASELVTELLQYIVEQSDILRFEAEALLSGIVLDTKNFTLRTGGSTFDAAAFLKRAGADTTDVKRLLQSDIKTAMERYAIIQKAKVYKSGIAIAAPETEENRIIAAQAADELLNILGIQASFVVFLERGVVNISARSIGDINVQLVLEKLGGGGNGSTAGAQINGKTIKEVVKDLVAAIDDYLEDYLE